MMTRRDLLRGLTASGGVGLLGLGCRTAAAAPPPETTSIRLSDARPGICIAPELVADELLRAEGFTDIEHVRIRSFEERLRLLATGRGDMLVTFVSSLIARLDAGDPIVLLAGAHVGCFELIGTPPRVRAVRDLRGKTVAISGVGGPDHLFLSVVAAQVGLDPRRDIHWVQHAPAEAMQLLAEGKIDALLNFPPVPQELRARKVGRAVLNSSIDRPWSQYFCCMIAARREFVRRYPIASKRAVRAIVKSADLCAREPERIARFLVDKGYAARYEYALQALRDVPYVKWREYDPEDAVRFYALRLHEAGLITSSPQKIIAQGTDWRFLAELKKELKG